MKFTFKSTGMDNEFPCQLFNRFYNDGPPDNERDGNIGGWRSYSHVIRDPHSAQWQAQNQIKGERWLATQQVVMPLLPPYDGCIYSSEPHNKTVTGDFYEHMRNFYLDNFSCAFQTMGDLLLDSFYPEEEHRQTNRFRRWQRTFLSELKYPACPVITTQMRTRSYDNLFGSDIHDIPPALLAELLQEELTFQREQEHFQQASTGGALSCISLSESNDPKEYCLIYTSCPGLQTLNFQKVEFQPSQAARPQLELRRKPVAFELGGPVRQVSAGTLQDAVYVGVRSDHFCGAWRVSDSSRPSPLEVVQVKEPATCLVVSPHVSRELLLASESGAVYLWTVGKGLTKVREEESNIYFNAKSAWRWCEFSAHPRVMVYADRTGADLTDFRTGENHSYTLFRIGKVSESKRGERVILSQYLSEYSAYIMDERMPSVPMLKWDHFMESPPMFTQVLAGSSPQSSHRVLLGSQKTQEIRMMQYSGGRDTACVSRGPHQKLLCPGEAMAHLPVRPPHRSQALQERLSLPAAGLAAIQSRRHLCVLQLTAAGDVFYQTLELCPENGTAEPPPRPPGSSDTQEDGGGGAQSPPHSDSSEDAQPSRRGQPGVSEAAVNDRLELFPPSDLEDDGGPQPGRSSDSSVQLASAAPAAAGNQGTLAREESCKWSEWLSMCDAIPVEQPPLSHCVTRTPALHFSVGHHGDPREQQLFQSLQQHLRASRSGGGVLVHSATGLPPLPVTPVPGAPEPSEWTDEPSRRLSEAWRGRWRQWWEDKLGLNREQKREALRRKRRQEKGRSQRRVALSGSFVSTASYQSDSEFSGVSSCASQDLGSDWDEDAASRPGSTRSAGASPELTLTSHLTVGKPLLQSTQASGQETSAPPLSGPAALESVVAEPSQSPPLLPTAESSRPSSIPASAQKRPRWTEQDLLESLFSSQEVGQEQLEGSRPVMAASSQLSSFSSSQRPPQVRTAFAQASQPKKKKARMGF